MGKSMYRAMIIFVICTLISFAITSCILEDEAKIAKAQPDITLDDQTPITEDSAVHEEAALDIEEDAIPSETPVESDVESDIEAQPSNSKADRNHAFTDVLLEYHDRMLWEKDKTLDIGKGKVAMADLYGDSDPELLFLYHTDSLTENLLIYTYDSAKGAVMLFNNEVLRQQADGGGNYCLFVTKSGKLMLYRSSNRDCYEWGFWNIGNELEKPFNFDRSSAELFYINDTKSENPSVIYEKGNASVAVDEFNNFASEMLSDIKTVIFQSDGLQTEDPENGLMKRGIYDIEPLWKDVPSFNADCISWKDAAAQLNSKLTIE